MFTKNKFFVQAILVVFTTFSTLAGAAEVNLQDKLNYELSKLRDYSISRNCRTICTAPGIVSPGGRCVAFFTKPNPGEQSLLNQPVGQNMSFLSRTARGGCCAVDEICTSNSGKLTVAETPDFTNAIFQFGEPIYNELPTGAEIVKYKYRNCSEASQKVSRTVSLSMQTNDRVSLTNTIGGSKSQNIKVNFGFKFGGFSAGGGASYTVNRSHSVARNESSSETVTVNRSATIPLSVPPKSLLVLEGALYSLSAQVPFKMRANADATVIKNLENVNFVSDVIERDNLIIESDGMVEAVAASEIDISVFSYDAECEGSTSFTNETSQFSVDQGYFKAIANAADNKPTFLAASNSEECLENQSCATTGSSCEATNDNNDASCSITCEVGQEALCLDGSGSGRPDCSCN